jgi:hypothetical protein
MRWTLFKDSPNGSPIQAPEFRISTDKFVDLPVKFEMLWLTYRRHKDSPNDKL